MRKRIAIHYLVFASGFAALSWQVVWQIKSSLALGVSAWGTALTLATTMGGMCIGALVMGHRLRGRTVENPLGIYGALEIGVGLLGLLLEPAFRLTERIDSWAYATMPGCVAAIYFLGIAISTGMAAICMGATLPVFGLVARRFKTSISALYGLNTLGAAAGALLAAFILIPTFGISHTIWTIAGTNIVVGAIACLFSRRQEPSSQPEEQASATQTISSGLTPRAAAIVVSVTGFSTFALEVAWFRSLTAAFHSTTCAFAVMVSVVLLALGAGARMVPIFRRRNIQVGTLLALAGGLVLLLTPIVERFDLFMLFGSTSFLSVLGTWFGMTLVVIGPPVFFLGVSLPWILDEQPTPRLWGSLYALNSFAAILGSLSAAWIFLPVIGLAQTAWLAGILVAGAGIYVLPRRRQWIAGIWTLASLAIAVVFVSGIGTTRVQAWGSTDMKPDKVLESYNGPDVTTSAVEYEGGHRALFIDGFTAAAQDTGKEKELHEHYMAWMGHLPMLLNPDPQNALVICFGTGQTANAVREENPAHLDIVDINPRVLRLAHNFATNRDVLHDTRVHTVIMDGRAYIRRTDKHYDVITLEPMPPNFAGVNALYSQEFYRMARTKLRPHGVIAQWVPFHLVSPRYAASIVQTFQSVFPNAVLWTDPASGTGIVVGSVDDGSVLTADWPGFARTQIARNMSEAEIKDAVLLDSEQLRRFGALGKLITDDNQLLAYGGAAMQSPYQGKQRQENYAIMDEIAGRKAP